MKLKHLNFCILAIGVLLFGAIGCEEQPAWRSPFISLSRQVSSDTLYFDATGGEAKILLETSRDWKIDEIPSWALVDPESGSASDGPVSISVTIPENVGYDRIAELLFIAGPSMESIYLHQTGPEGVDDGIIDITCAAFAALPDDDGNTYRLKGAISGSINTTYGNFDVMDETGSVYVYGVTNLAEFKDKIKSGAHISVTGPKTTYNGKVEMKNATIEEITEGEVIRPTNITDISCADFNQLTDTEGWYRLKGVVTGSINTTYGNFDVKDATGQVYVYGVDNIAEHSDIAAGDSIAVVGHYYLYTNKNTGATKVEMMNGYIEWRKGGAGNERPTDITDITCSAFAQLTDTEGWYRLKGVVSGSINTTYGNFDVKDETGSVYVYGVDNIKQYTTLAANDSIAVVGHYFLYTNPNTQATKVEMKDGYIEWYKSGGGGGGTTTGGPDPASVVKSTISDFRAAQTGTGTWYELTGVVTEIINATYGNLMLKDATDTVYVYGVVKEYATSNNKTFNTLGVNQTDTLTIWTLRDEYSGRVEAGGTVPAVYVSHKAGAGVPTTATHPFTSNLTWTLGNKGTAAKVVIQGTEYNAFKLGTASIAGSATVTVPAGNSKVSFYAMGWTGIDGKLKVSGGAASQTFTVKQNAGCNNNSPFTITTITDSDWYTLDFGAALTEDTTVSFETQSGGLRTIVFGVNAE